MLLAFVVIAVWEKFSERQTTVARESAAASALFHYAEGTEPEAAKLHDRLVDYLRLTIEKDWPAMAADSEDRDTSHALDQLYRAAMALNQTSTRSTADMSEVFTQIDNLTLARRVRLHLSTGLVPDVIWMNTSLISTPRPSNASRAAPMSETIKYSPCAEPGAAAVTAPCSWRSCAKKARTLTRRSSRRN